MNILSIISQIQAEKRERNIVPSYVLFNELLKSSKLSSEYLNTELKKLRIEGKIRRGKTINDIWIEIIK